MTILLASKLGPHERSAPPAFETRGSFQQDDREGPIKLIYIAGYGRSGTTLLDIALGQRPGVMGAGEIATLARHVWDNDEFCACGVPVSQCSYWSEIVEQWQEGETTNILSRYRQAQLGTESIVAPGRFMGGLKRSGYAPDTAKLLHAIANISNCPIVVDSSKLPGRGFASSDLSGVDLYVVHVVRDGRGVAWSMSKGYKRQVDKGVQRELRPKWLLHTALRWAIVNVAADLLCRRIGKSRAMRVRYEDFVADPEATVDRILDMVDGRKPIADDDRGGPMTPQHQVAGSRHRMAKSITITKDESWKSKMPRYKQILFALICAPLFRRYGYPLRPF